MPIVVVTHDAAATDPLELADAGKESFILVPDARGLITFTTQLVAFQMRTPIRCRGQASQAGDACREVIDQLLEANALQRLRAAQGVLGCGGSTTTPVWKPSTTGPAAQCEQYRCQVQFSTTTYCARAPMGSEADAVGRPTPNACQATDSGWTPATRRVLCRLTDDRVPRAADRRVTPGE
ncbi:hypothetical protein ACWC24_33640 [Streptomyces sp. NPDC001443]